MSLGLNQTIVFALFMVIIGAFIGTEDLGQYILKALSDKNGAGIGLTLGLCVAFGQHRSGIVPEITAKNADLFGDLSLCGILADLGRNASDPCRGRPVPHRGLFGFRENRAPHWVCDWALVRRCRRGHRALLGQLCDQSAA